MKVFSRENHFFEENNLNTTHLNLFHLKINFMAGALVVQGDKNQNHVKPANSF